MKVTGNIGKIATVLVGLALCVLSVGAGKGANGSHAQPFYIHGSYTSTYQPDGSFTFVEVGEATYFGRYANNGWGPVMDNGNLLHLGEGILTTARGDKSYWVVNLNAPTRVIFNGGTGRFADDSGSFDITYTSIVTNPDGSVTYTYTGRGTITFEE